MHDEPKLGWKTVDLTHEIPATFLEKEIASHRPQVMIDKDSRWGRSHLRLHKDGRGFFVRAGRRGSSKQYLGKCKITFFDGEPTLLAFTFANHDAFEDEQRRRWDAQWEAREAAR